MHLIRAVVGQAFSIGIPVIVVLLVMALSGLGGAAAITFALAFLGGPFGMIGGIILLIAMSLFISWLGRRRRRRR